MPETPAPAAPASPLDSMLCFALYSASNAVAQAHRAVLAPWGLTYTQYVALVELATAPDGLAVKELGSRMGLDSGTLSPLLRRLEQRGLLSRRRGSADERVVTVALTDAGRAARDELAESIGCLAPGYGVESAAQLDELLAALHRVSDGMRAVAAGAPAAAPAAPVRAASVRTTAVPAASVAAAAAAGTPT